jgi:hypothetical protein
VPPDKRMKKENINPIWFFFENDPEQCIRNVHKRADGRKVSEGYIRELSAKYVIPTSGIVLKVYRGDNDES